MTNEEFVAEHRGETVRLTSKCAAKWKKMFPESTPEELLGVVLKRNWHPYVSVLWRNKGNVGNYNADELEVADSGECSVRCCCGDRETQVPVAQTDRAVVS